MPRQIITQIEDRKKSIAELEREVAQLHSSAAPPDALDERLRETLELYLAKSFKDDRFARLDQAGESDVARQTELHQVFVDLEVKPRPGPRMRRRAILPFATTASDKLDLLDPPQGAAKEAPLSAMEILLRESEPWIVLVGGPGQGKSTIGQYLAQVHRAALLGRTDALRQGDRPQPFVADRPRVPFRIILKDFAQWLADGPDLDTVEAYLAQRHILRATSREVAPEDLQKILRGRPILAIFDGLDEVLDPALRERVVGLLFDFLDRAAQLGADAQALATTRPTGYNDQFGPERFWHLEIQPMSEKSVAGYAELWLDAKATTDDERRRIRDTLKECQSEAHTRLLLTTPLQVTIILLIIKDGGRPPSQREALFQEYWSTILRREKAKASGVITSEESRLFDLHAYLAYLLQRRAAANQVGSLIAQDEFEREVRRFLRGKDSFSPDEAIAQNAARMIAEAHERLVLIVSPEPGKFGFELRSLQEFFAAAYLAQSARDTDQRFARLKAIARSEHWRNVALFFSGRIVRSFGGEAANIMTVCRAIDRDPPDRYLRRGAWLALEIAADSALAANRDLQYDALDYGLGVLDNTYNYSERERIKTALARLSPDDRRDMLKPLLARRVAAAQPDALSYPLELYGQFVGPDQTFVEGLERLLAQERADLIEAALNLGFKWGADPDWLARQIERFWLIWGPEQGGNQLWNWWRSAPQLVQAVIALWSPSAERAAALLSDLPLYLLPAASGFSRLVASFSIPASLADQIITALQCQTLIEAIRTSIGSEDLALPELGDVRLWALDQVHEERQAASSSAAPSQFLLDQLLARADLLPALRALVWRLYWALYDLDEARIAAFLIELRGWSQSSVVPKGFWRIWLRGIRPLAGRQIERLARGDEAAALPQFLMLAQERELNAQVRADVRALAQTRRPQELASILLGWRFGEPTDTPELNALAARFGLTSAELIEAQQYSWPRIESYSAKDLRRIFTKIAEALERPDEDISVLLFVFNAEWRITRPLAAQGRQLLASLLTTAPKRPQYIAVAICLFFKLLASGQAAIDLCPALLRQIAEHVDSLDYLSTSSIARSLLSIAPKTLARLAAYLEDPDEAVRKGAIALWAALANSIVNRHLYFPDAQRDTSAWERLRSLRLDWRIGLALACAADSASRRQGARLLLLADFPLGDAQRRGELLAGLARAKEGYLYIWENLLRNIDLSRDAAGGSALLEAILARPRDYAPGIAGAALERYSELAGAAGDDLAGSEAALGLPMA